MRITPLALALLMASQAFAQTGTQPGKDVTPQVNGPAQTISPNVPRRLRENLAKMQEQLHAEMTACPVGFSVERKSTPGLQAARNAGAEPRQALDVSLRTNERKIVEADVTVHGMAFRPRIIGASTNEAEDTPEEFVLRGTPDAPIELSSISLQRLGTVSWVELTRLVYSDGTTWVPVGNTHCTTRPSMLVLVNSSTR